MAFTYRVWVGLVGQPQRLLVELLLQVGLSGVQGCELLPDFPATGPQALIVGVLDRAEGHPWGESGIPSSSVTYLCWQDPM